MEELTCATGDGSAYRGTISETESGKTCQLWASQNPHEHSRTPWKYPCKGLKSNYCRNPDNERMPWCYTTDPGTRWEYCKVPTCGNEPVPGTPKPPTIVEELTCATGDGSAYRGTISVTGSGKTCQLWASQNPHEHSRTPEKYPCKGLTSNYCRNPDNEKMPWCYTTDPGTRWEYCKVPTCGNEPVPAPTILEELTCATGDGSAYRGTISETRSGKTCQLWASQNPHEHSRTPENYPWKGLTSNYCRNPDNEKMPWCYTTDPGTRWEYCKVPTCGNEPVPAPKPPTILEEPTCATGDGSAYRGTISETRSGKTCQLWASQNPHEHSRTPEKYPWKGLKSNYCRNPDNERMPWCYTTDPGTRWEYCKVPTCGNEPVPAPKPPTIVEELTCATGDGSAYRGTISVTGSGKTCQLWASQNPHEHSRTPENYPCKGLKSNYCRNPDNEKMPWCYTTDPGTRWEYCKVPTCGNEPVPASKPPTIMEELTCATGDGSAYRGPISETESGKTCQLWASQNPHEHSRTPENYPCKGLKSNYCRNPDNETMPWCYTTDPGTRWEYCRVPTCGNEPVPAGLKCGQAKVKPGKCFNQIVGGCESKPHSWPWQISLRTNSHQHFCGGTLIKPQWVVTAAHCLESPHPAAYKVYLGTHTQKANEASKQVRDVKKLILEPRNLDIALLKLDSPAIINDMVMPACLPEKDYIVPHLAECHATGWGETRGTGGDGVLKQSRLPVIENKVCNRPAYLSGQVRDHEMCAGYIEGGTDSCQGDSGGPLVCHSDNTFVLQGVTSWGEDCAKPMKPGVYTRVSKFVDWIAEEIKNNS
ncbi:apolipoprotein(a)-like [Conger conger]|uniref:apolipoprotein(a)-like n=1 Tax=Conger conger TaxID=82655 RepID=UPI002A5A8F3A|nr:apolipoprotein(a)-like [Conger conger]